MDCACVSYYIGSTPPFCSTYNENERNEAPNHLNDPTKWLMLFTKLTNECTFGNGNGYNTHTHKKWVKRNGKEYINSYLWGKSRTKRQYDEVQCIEGLKPADCVVADNTFILFDEDPLYGCLYKYLMAFKWPICMHYTKFIQQSLIEYLWNSWGFFQTDVKQ